MKESNNEEIERIDFENILVVIFIIAGFLNIYANRLRQEYLKTEDNNKNKQAHEIYIFIIIVSIFAYSYFVKRNYNFYKKSKTSNDDFERNKLNFIGSLFLLIGAMFILFSELNNNQVDEESIF